MLFSDVPQTSATKKVLKQAACLAENASASHVHPEHVLEALLRSHVPSIVAAAKTFGLAPLPINQMGFRLELQKKHGYPKKRARRFDPLEPDEVLVRMMNRARLETVQPMRRQDGEVSVEHLLIGLIAEPMPSIVRDYLDGEDFKGDKRFDYVKLRQFFIRYHEREGELISA